MKSFNFVILACLSFIVGAAYISRHPNYFHHDKPPPARTAADDIKDALYRDPRVIEVRIAKTLDTEILIALQDTARDDLAGSLCQRGALYGMRSVRLFDIATASQPEADRTALASRQCQETTKP